METPGSLLARKMRGDTSITNQDIANASLSHLRGMGAPVQQVSVGEAKATANQLSDFEAGEKVRYVPYHANGNARHEDCQDGEVSSVGERYVFVNFGGSTPQGCNPDQLIWR